MQKFVAIFEPHVGRQISNSAPEERFVLTKCFDEESSNLQDMKNAYHFLELQ